MPQQQVGLVEALEITLGGRVVGVQVGVQRKRQLAIGGFDDFKVIRRRNSKQGARLLETHRVLAAHASLSVLRRDVGQGFRNALSPLAVEPLAGEIRPPLTGKFFVRRLGIDARTILGRHGVALGVDDVSSKIGPCSANIGTGRVNGAAYCIKDAVIVCAGDKAILSIYMLCKTRQHCFFVKLDIVGETFNIRIGQNNAPHALAAVAAPLARKSYNRWHRHF